MNDKNDLSTPLTSSPISSHACGQTVWRLTMCAIKVYMEMSHTCVVTMLFMCNDFWQHSTSRINHFRLRSSNCIRHCTKCRAAR